jgi:hypothetical protein
MLAGSTARRQGTETFPAGYQALRDQLVQDGRMVDGPSPELFRFAADVTFASPSATRIHSGGTIGQRPAGVEGQGERPALSRLAGGAAAIGLIQRLLARATTVYRISRYVWQTSRSGVGSEARYIRRG